MGCISHPKVLSSWMLWFWTYHTKLGDVLSDELWSFYPWTSSDVSDAQEHLFSCWLLSIRRYLTMLWMLLLCHSLFTLSRDTSLPVVSIDMLNSSTSRLVAFVEFYKAPYPSTLTCLHGCCSFFNVVRMKRMMWKGVSLYSVENTHIIVVFTHTTVNMEVNPRMEAPLYNQNSMWISSPGWRLMEKLSFLWGDFQIWCVTYCTWCLV